MLVASLIVTAITVSRHIALKSELATLAEREKAAAERTALTEASANERIARTEAAATERIKQIERDAELRIKQAETASGKEFERMLSDSEKHFKLIANEVLANSTDRLRQQSETQIKDILTPLKENIE